jgi:hypothetical protein
MFIKNRHSFNPFNKYYKLRNFNKLAYKKGQDKVININKEIFIFLKFFTLFTLNKVRFITKHLLFYLYKLF